MARTSRQSAAVRSATVQQDASPSAKQHATALLLGRGRWSFLYALASSWAGWVQALKTGLGRHCRQALPAGTALPGLAGGGSSGEEAVT